MRETIAIILDKNTNEEEFNKIVHEKITPYLESTEVCEYKDERFYTREAIEEEYQNRINEWRNLSPEKLERRMKKENCSSVDEYIELALRVYGWSTLEEFAKAMHGIIRFEGNASVYMTNPNGFIDYYHIREVNLAKESNIEELCIEISEIIDKDNTLIRREKQKDYSKPSQVFTEKLNKVSPDDYIAVIRAHF